MCMHLARLLLKQSYDLVHVDRLLNLFPTDLSPFQSFGFLQSQMQSSRNGLEH